MATLYTIGHSTRTIEDLIRTLQAHEIKTLVDIRAFPASKRLPHFNREALEQSMPAAGIHYVWMKGLGGYRKKSREDSPNTGLRNVSFRNYADYMLTPKFEDSIADLLNLADTSRAAYMCAERVWFQCHRMLVSDWLTAHGHTVLHIDAEGAPKPHRLTPEARVIDNQLVYGPEGLFP